ncbi:Type 3 secretion system secretin [Paraburkholderia humisilvae]|uniref:Type 3 secretion system secretin n=2 Tax=Paraburkholderia humisilvae TaxID=627669 RepID=A0A6J5F1E4_9BURK|nr:Type 3 secretion system secretin [Paraburkholderia humisilvae]
MRCAVLAVAAAAAVGASAAVCAAAVPWRTDVINYVADHKDLHDVLREMSSASGVPIWISAKVQGNVSGRFEMKPQQLLDRMASTFGLVWYYDGATLRVYDTDELKTVTIGLQLATNADLRRALERLDLADARFPLRYDDLTRTVIVSGPPRYVELIQDVANLVDRNSQDAQRHQVVRLFPLQYAWATDHTVTVDGQSITIRGVATILHSLYAGAAPGGSQTAPQSSSRRLRSVGDPSGATDGKIQRASYAPAAGANWTAGLPGLLGGGGGGGDRPAQRNAPLPNDNRAATPDTAYDDHGSREVDVAPGDEPTIQPDPRTNSVLVRDYPDRMASFESLIRSLDVRPAVVEIDASIIEITDNALEQIGVDWRLHSGSVDFETGNGQSVQASPSASLNPNGFPDLSNGNTSSSLSAIPTTPAGGVFTAVLGNAGRFLLTRVSALQQTDQAVLNATPKVATLDNVEAIIDNKQTFYVPVAGYQSADLYSISAGVSLRVLPMIVRHDDATSIRLNVHIEDGQLTGQTVGNLPVVTNSTIDTQALIAQGESLLIAGYSVDQSDNMQTGIPVLSKIPVLGALFRHKNKSGQKFQRLFLLTPRIVVPTAGGPAEANGNAAAKAEAEATNANAIAAAQ